MARKATPKPVRTKVVIKDTIELLINNKKIIGLITLIYAVLYLLFVQALSAPLSSSLIKNNFLSTLTGNAKQATASFNTFTYLLSTNTASSSSAVAPFYQVVLIVVFSLAFIFLFRNIYKKNKISVKGVMYNSMYPLIPYFLTVLIVLVELIPFDIGISIYSIASSSSISTNIFQQIFWIILLAGLTSLSLYFIATSIIATYIVTLPNMTPISALRSAKNVVNGRRLTVIKHLILLPIILIAIAAVVLIPIILVLPAIASWLYLIYIILMLPIVHAYLYNLYRELIK